MIERNSHSTNQEITVKSKAFFQGKKLIIRMEISGQTILENFIPVRARTHAGVTHTPSSCPYTPRIISLSEVFPNSKKLIKKTLPILRETKEERSTKFLPLAKQLSKTIQTHKHINHNLNHIKTWTNEMRKLSEGSGVSYERIEKALDWYADNIGCEFVPVIESGYSLRLKFMKLEACISRRDCDYTKPKFIIDDGIKYVLDKDGKYRHPRTGSILVP